jgi:signal transduction histidine kinase
MTTPERHTTSLRLRLMLALALIVTVTGTLFAYGVLFMKEKLEEVIFGNMLRAQLQELLMELDNGSYERNQLFRGWDFHYEDNGRIDPELHALSPGSHHSVRMGERYYQVEVTLREGHPVYLTYDITEWELLEHELLRFLAYGIAALLVVALLMGHQASRAVLAPINALAERLSSMQPRLRKQRIAQDFPGDEINRIARAFDVYLERLDQFVERERSFTASASHELRTPLSVMLGALDVLDAQDQAPATQRAVARLRRACNEMHAFVDATLRLAREEATTIDEGAPVNVAQVLKGLFEDMQPLLRERNISVDCAVPSSFVLEQSESLVQILLGNLLRNAIEHTRDGHIGIRLQERTLTLQDSGSGIAPEHLQHVFERNFTTKRDGVGLGLDLVRRICDRCGWRVSLASEPGKGTGVTLQF